MTNHQKILIVAYAGQGHVIPALRFANRLTNMGVDVTFCTSLSVVQNINIETIPHGLTFAPFSDGHENGKQPRTNLSQFMSDFETNCSSAIVEIITSARVVGKPFDLLVYTTVIPWAARVAQAQGIKSALLWCQSATILNIYYYYFNEYQSLISSSNNTLSISLPGLPPLTNADFPSFLLSSCPEFEKFLLLTAKDHIDVLKISPKILVNTFDELEFESINAIEKLEFFPIGPLIPTEFFITNNSSISSSGGDFFDKHEDDYVYIEWLNTKQKSSVVYVSFGTLAMFSMDQLDEIANGLLEIGLPFLWVILDNEQVTKLSKLDELKKQGMIVGWCSQLTVLSHESIGCFVTHGGWNSTVESLAAAVPTVVFPQWSDQGNNAKMIEDVWKTGVRVKPRDEDGVLEGKEMMKCVKLVMGNEEMKKNAEKWRELAMEAFNNGGSSAINLQAFLDGCK